MKSLCLKADGKTESRITGGALASNYIPRDEVFDEVKRSGFLGDFIKGQKHKAVGDIFDLDKEFRDFDEIRDMFAPVGEESNLETMASHQTKPFELLRNFAFAAGDDKNTFKYPMPRLIAGKGHLEKNCSLNNVD